MAIELASVAIARGSAWLRMRNATNIDTPWQATNRTSPIRCNSTNQLNNSATVDLRCVFWIDDRIRAADRPQARPG